MKRPVWTMVLTFLAAWYAADGIRTLIAGGPIRLVHVAIILAASLRLVVSEWSR